jgi:hypothetical protein
MAETPLKGRGGGLQAGWETWRTVPGVHRNVPGVPTAPLFSPPPPGQSSHGSSGHGSEVGFVAPPPPLPQHQQHQQQRQGSGSGAGGGDDAPTPRLQGSHLAPELIAPSSPSSLHAGPSPPSTPRGSSGGVTAAAAAAAGAGAAGALGPTRTLWAFFLRELHWGHALSWRQRGAPTEHVMNFLRVTLSLEPFLSFGHLLCIDLFLFHFTMLPLRCAGALWRLLALAAAALLRRLGLGGGGGAGGGFTQAQAYDLIKGALFVAATLALGAVQVSRVYHYIRGEAIIKLCVGEGVAPAPLPPRTPWASFPPFHTHLHTYTFMPPHLPTRQLCYL